MNVTSALARWSRKSNRRRLVEAMARVFPWIGAGVAIALLAFARGGIAIGVAVAAVGAAAIAVLTAGIVRRTWRDPAATARAIDHAHRTADLLQTALAIEARRERAVLEDVVVARAEALVPDLEATAVPRLKLRSSAAGGLTAVAAIALLVFFGSGGAPDAAAAAKDAVGVLGERDRAAAKAIGNAIDALASDASLPAGVRDKVARAKDALAKAGAATNGRAAMAALSEASRLLDEAAKAMASAKSLTPEALDKMSSSQLADELAKAAKHGDSQKLSAAAREALKRASTTPSEAAELAAALKQAIAQAKQNAGEAGAAAQRLDKLGAAADQLAANDVAAAKAELGELARSTAGTAPPRDARAGKLDSARQAMAALRDAQRSAMNGTPSADARADAARAGAGRQQGSGEQGTGTQPGTQPGNGNGTGKGQPGNGPPTGTAPGEPHGDQLSVLQAPSGSAPPGGAAGTSGSHGQTTPSGATAPETVAAEEVQTQQPPPSPEGVIRAIAERSAGEHRSEKFGSIRDYYQAIAEAAIHRDQIPLTRRDFIQRYFEALRTREEP